MTGTPVSERSWLFRAPWLFWCTIDPRINHEARIHHGKFRTPELAIDSPLLEWQNEHVRRLGSGSQRWREPGAESTRPADREARRTGRPGWAAAGGRGRPGNLLCSRGLPDLFFPPVWSPIP